jgi:hypothetical protein
VNLTRIESLTEVGYLPMLDREVPNITNIIDKLLLLSNSPRKKSSHYPSGARVVAERGILGACARQQFYGWQGEAEEEKDNLEEDISGLWKMDMGNAIHAWIGKKLHARFNVVEEYPIEYHPEFLQNPVRGRIDNLILSEEFGNFGVEIKSGYGRGITNRESGVKYIGPKESHLMQAFIYLVVSRLPEEEKAKYMPLHIGDNPREFLLPPLDFFVIYYIARDNAYRTAFYLDLMDAETVLHRFGSILSEARQEVIRGKSFIPVVSDGKNIFVLEEISFRGIIESYADVEYHVTNNITPQRDFELHFTEINGQMNIDRKMSDWQCTYCGFKEICYLRDKEIP